MSHNEVNDTPDNFAAHRVILKNIITEVIFGLHGENGKLSRDAEYPTSLGTVRVKTHDASPDLVSTVYLEGHRLYKLYIDCTQPRDKHSMFEMVATKLDRESFISQANKVLNKVPEFKKTQI